MEFARTGKKRILFAIVSGGTSQRVRPAIRRVRIAGSDLGGVLSAVGDTHTNTERPDATNEGAQVASLIDKAAD